MGFGKNEFSWQLPGDFWMLYRYTSNFQWVTSATTKQLRAQLPRGASHKFSANCSEISREHPKIVAYPPHIPLYNSGLGIPNNPYPSLDYRGNPVLRTYLTYLDR